MNNTSTTTTNTSIPITKMVNDLFLQWISLPDTRTTLCAALQSVRTNSKMPDPIIYPKVCWKFSSMIEHLSFQSYVTRGGGFSKPQHFDSPPVSPVPRTASSPRSGLSSIPSTGDSTLNFSNSAEDRKQRSLKKKYPVINGSTTPSSAITSNIDQQQVNCSISFFRISNRRVVSISRRRRREKKNVSSFGSSDFLPSLLVVIIHPLHHMYSGYGRRKISC